MWTLAYNGTEATFATWGFTEPALVSASQSRTTFSVRMPGAANLVAAPPIPYWGYVVIWRGRTAKVGGGYESGEIVFQGRQVTQRLLADPSAPTETLIFADAWFDMENLVYQQQWSLKNGSSPISSQYFARLCLFQNYEERTVGGVSLVPGQLITNGQQIADIIDFAADCGVEIQAGTIDPIFQLPIYQVKAIMCAEALLMCLRPTPDAVTWLDYSTTPPTFHCRQRSNLVAVTLPYADGTRHKSSEIVPRPDLQVPCVSLQYQKTNTDNGAVYTLFDVETYPAEVSPLQVGALVCPIDLRGGSRTDLRVTVKAVACDPTSLAWWRLKKPDLKNTDRYTALALVSGSLTVKDDAGATVSLVDMPNEHVMGEVLSWMKNPSAITSKQVTISGKFTYVEKDPEKPNLGSVHEVTANNPHEFSVRVKLTNSAVGEVTYSALEHLDPGETAPEELAQKIYESLATLQYEGTHVVVDGQSGAETMTIVGVKNKLNISGGAAAWATMGAVIQQVEIDFFRGRTAVMFGPAKHIAPGDLAELLQTWRFRLIFDNPNLRVSAEESSSGGGADIGGETAAENTTNSNAPLAVHTVTAQL